jgi:hypothetical protein
LNLAGDPPQLAQALHFLLEFLMARFDATLAAQAEARL